MLQTPLSASQLDFLSPSYTVPAVPGFDVSGGPLSMDPITNSMLNTPSSFAQRITPGNTDQGGLFGGMNGFQTAQTILGGLGTIGSLWNAFQAQKLAKKQFAFSKEYANANLANQIKSYNTALEDRARSRAAVEGQSSESAQAYVDANKLVR